MAASESDTPVRIAARSDAGGGLWLVRFQGAPAILASHRWPGQYVTVAPLVPGAPPSYFVLANPVGAAAAEIVLRLRDGDEIAERLTQAPVGTAVSMSVAQGAGFPCDRAAGRPLWVAVAGTGIAAARSIAAFRRATGEEDVRTTALLIGVRRFADLPLRAELEELASAGMQVTVCTSREVHDTPSVKKGELHVAPGYVQAALAVAMPTPPPRDARLFVAGPDAMIAALRVVARTRGLDERDVHTNY